MDIPRVLVVEDDPDDARIICRALQRWKPDISITIAEDGVAALQILRAFLPDSLPDLVLLDIKLPLMNGFEVLTEIRSKGPLKELRVVMLSSSDEPCDIRQALALGANGYVLKAVDYGVFVNHVRALAEGWDGDPQALLIISHESRPK